MDPQIASLCIVHGDDESAKQIDICKFRSNAVKTKLKFIGGIPTTHVWVCRMQCPSDSWALSKEEVRWMEIANKEKVRWCRYFGWIRGRDFGYFVIGFSILI